MSKKIIYVVSTRDKETGQVFLERLVETNTAANAERHVVNETVKARRARMSDVAGLMGDGVKVETPGEGGRTSSEG